MTNKPVAWMLKDESWNDFCRYSSYPTEGAIPLYTHPVNVCKHGVDDGACKECYLESSNPYKAITNTKIEPTAVSYTHPVKVNYEFNSSQVKELTDEDYKEALACLQFALDDTLDYIKLNNLGGENNHWIVWARAILRKARE